MKQCRDQAVGPDGSVWSCSGCLLHCKSPLWSWLGETWMHKTKCPMGLKRHTPFSNASPGALAFPSGEDFRIASEQGLGHQDLLSAPPPSPPHLCGSLEGLREASWLGGLCKMATSLPSGIKSLTQKPESPKSCQGAGTSTLPCPAVLLSILLLQTQPKGSQTSPVPSSSCPMVLS